MLLKVVVYSVLVFALACGAAGCKAKKISASQANGFCMASASFEGSCLDPYEACGIYYEVMQGEYETAQQCRNACIRAGNKMQHGTVTFGCGGVSGRGRGYCTQYCTGAYP